MVVSRIDTRPTGMRERSFALVNSETGATTKFGRGTDFPCSEYTFPSVEATGPEYPAVGHHSFVAGRKNLAPDFFEASFGVVDPNAVDKMSRLIAAWNMANFRRPRMGGHSLYYVLGGRSRMMYGSPSRIAPKYNGFKSSFHEGVLRFTPSSAFYFDSRETTADWGDLIQANASGSPSAAIFLTESGTEVPTPLSFDIWLTAPTARVDVKVEIRDANHDWRTVLLLVGMNGRMKIDNSPGFSMSSHEPPNVTSSTPRTTGADLISPTTPAFRDMLLWPGDDQFRVTATSRNSVSAGVVAMITWRDCYAGA